MEWRLSTHPPTVDWVMQPGSYRSPVHLAGLLQIADSKHLAEANQPGNKINQTRLAVGLALLAFGCLQGF
jgi:hypothetical protein